MQERKSQNRQQTCASSIWGYKVTITLKMRKREITAKQDSCAVQTTNRFENMNFICNQCEEFACVCNDLTYTPQFPHTVQNLHDTTHSVNHDSPVSNVMHNNVLDLKLPTKGFNIGYLNIQAYVVKICVNLMKLNVCLQLTIMIVYMFSV